MTLALVDPGGRPLGLLPLPGATPSPWWQEVGEVVDLARDTCGIDVTVLRLLAVASPFPGGAVTYVAEYSGPPPAGLDRADPEWTRPDPVRMPWANPGGPAAALAWARQALDRPVTAARQVRSWNLSSVWRLDTGTGPVWLKQVPGFLGHEGTLLRWLDRPTVPVPLAVAGCRTLLPDLPDGDPRGPADWAAMLAELLTIQADAVERVPELLALGVPDQRAGAFVRAAERVVAGRTGPDSDRLAQIVAALPRLLAELAACGVPDTLVHGDFHPGNARVGERVVLYDWGDSVIGHPALDLLRLRHWTHAPELADQWCAFWRATVPGSDPERAVGLMPVIAALRDAITYDRFVRAVEPAERPYHADDVPAALAAAVHTMDGIRIR